MHDSLVIPPSSLRLNNPAGKGRRQVEPMAQPAGDADTLPTQTPQAPAAPPVQIPQILYIQSPPIYPQPPYPGYPGLPPNNFQGTTDQLAPGQGSQTNSGSTTPIIELSHDNPELFPRVRDWLATMDNGPRGIDNVNFSQYSEVFESHGYWRLNQFWEEAATVTDTMALGKLCNIPVGTIKLLMKYAKQDCLRACAEADLKL